MRVAAVLLGACVGRAVAESFTCDGSKKLPDAWVNDDYCDCIDGSDEPRTGACPGAILQCENKLHRPTQVIASRVNDGVCDCCDGGDEWAAPKTCPNMCAELAREAFGNLERACQRQAELVRKGREAEVERTDKLKTARDDISVKEPDALVLREKRDAAEVDEKAELAARQTRLEAGEVATALHLSELTREMAAHALVRLALSKGVDGVDKLYDALAAHADLTGLMEDVDSADLLEIAMNLRDEQLEARNKQKQESANPDAEQQSVIPDAEGACPAHAACGHEAELIALLPVAEMTREALMSVLDTFVKREYLMPTMAQAARDLLGGVGIVLDGTAVAAALELLVPLKHVEANAARAALSAVEVAVRESMRTLEKYEPLESLSAAGGFGADEGWFHLHGKCFEHEAKVEGEGEGSLKYSFCPFSELKQDGHSLGKYAGWRGLDAGARDALMRNGREPAARGMMVFEDGSPCDETPRKAVILFECGEEDKLVEVTEIGHCEYEGWFQTPSACSVDVLAQRYAELEAQAAKEGITFKGSEALQKLMTA